jgi:tetratricopeptide (TPR) repeat protein
MKPFCYVAILLLQLVVLFVQGQSNADSLLRIVQEDRRDTAEAKALNALGLSFARKDIQKSKSYYLQSMPISLNGGFIKPLSYSYAQLSMLYGDLGLIDSSYYYLTLLKKLGAANPSIKVNYLQAAGLYYKRQNKFKEAMPFMLEGLAMTRAELRTDSSVKAGLAWQGRC